DSAPVVEALLCRDPEAVLVVRSEGRIVGTVIAGWDGWRAHLYRLAVHPDHRRQGLARVLLDAAEDRLRALGAGR
ncbi:GNAT family N-acetyltransferase, partial [Escherichia coli]